MLVGWPEQKSQVPIPIRDYWNYRDKISLHNGILFKHQRIIIPKKITPSKVPDRPWSRVAVDMFTLHRKEYVALVDYYSDFVEVQEVADTTSPTIIQF